MTEMLNKEFSRKTFLRGSGVLIVGFSVLGGALAGKAQAADPPYGSPDANQLDTWIAIHADNTASIYTGRVELGQGSATGYLQIAGEELDMEINQLKFVRHETGVTPFTGENSGSSGIKGAGTMVRAAAAHARQTLLGLASASLGVPVASLTVNAGVVSGGGKSVRYGELIGDKRFNVTLPVVASSVSQFSGVGNSVFRSPIVAPVLNPGQAPAKSSTQYKVVGTRVPRIDIPDKVSGSYTYVHNIRVPGMVHGRIVWQRGQGAYGTPDHVVSIDGESVKQFPNVEIVRKGDFVGVVAPREYEAIQAAAQLKVKWAERAPLPGVGNLYANMRKQAANGYMSPSVGANSGNVDAAFASAAHVVTASYGYPFNGHMPIGPDCVVADVKPDSALIFSGTQNAYKVRKQVAEVLGLPQPAVRVVYFEASSSFGGSALKNEETAAAAALMSQAVGKPVRLQLMRWDEHGYDFFDAPQLNDIRGGVDANGKIVAFEVTRYTIPYGTSVPTIEQMLGHPIQSSDQATISLSSINGGQYTIPNIRLTAISLPPVNAGFLKVGPVRAPQDFGLGFATQQMFDELAYAAQMDPVAFHRLNISTSDTGRWLAVLDAVVEASKWQPKVAASQLSDADVVSGRGITLGARGFTPGLGAAIADVEVNKKTGKIVVKHVYTAQDYGVVIGPDLVASQAMGMTMHAASRVLMEGAEFNRNAVTSLDWVGYPILRFQDHPRHTHVIITRPDQPTAPSSEEFMPTIAAAIANAFFDATGVRMRTAPMTPVRVRAALKAAGVA